MSSFRKHKDVVCGLASALQVLIACGLSACSSTQHPRAERHAVVEFTLNAIVVGTITNSGSVGSEDEHGHYTKGLNIDAFKVVGLGTPAEREYPLHVSPLSLDSPQRRDYVLAAIGEGKSVTGRLIVAEFDAEIEPTPYTVLLRICVWNRGPGHNHSGWQDVVIPGPRWNPDAYENDTRRVNYSLGKQLSDPQADVELRFGWRSYGRE